MNYPEFQIKYDILFTAIVAAVTFSGLIVPVFIESGLFVLLLQLSSALGLICVMAYVFTATLFLEACSAKNDISANRYKVAAKIFQWASILISTAVIILFTTL